VQSLSRTVVPLVIGVPPHIKQLKIENLPLNEPQKSELLSLFVKFAEVFSKDSSDVGLTSVAVHRINTGDSLPIKQHPYRTNPVKRALIEKHVDQLLKKGHIVPSFSDWSSPVVLAPKKNEPDGRFCVDYRKLNSVTKIDAYPIPRIDETLDALGGACCYFSILDATSGYHQIPVHKDDVQKTCFTTAVGNFEYSVMPFGLCNAPSTFQRAMAQVLTGLQFKCCLVYIDDVIVYSKSFAEHTQHLQAVLERFRQANIKLKPTKCQICKDEVKYLGHVISKDGVHVDKSSTDAVRKMKVPTTIPEVRSFLGSVGFYSRFIYDFASDLPVTIGDQVRVNYPFPAASQSRVSISFDLIVFYMPTCTVMPNPWGYWWMFVAQSLC